MTTNFSHLHVRSGFSWGYGTATPEEMVERAAGLGMGALALTDRDTLASIPRLMQACTGTGVSPIVGAEITMETKGVRGHVVLLAESGRGYQSLCKLITSYRLDAEDRHNPICPLPTLLEHAEGLLCLTGSIPFGLLPSMLLSRDSTVSRGARRLATLLLDAFGDDFYMEISDDRTEGSRRRMARVANFAEEIGLPLAATNEVAYLYPADHRLHDVLVADANLTAMPGPGYRPTDRLHLVSAEEMYRLFADRPEALTNTAAIAERCAGSVRLDGRVHMPAARLAPGEGPDRKLFALTIGGARERYGKLDKQVVSRLRREISCIEGLGFAPYFLIAREAVDIAHEKGVPVTGRGSSANSIVAYCLGLTQPEPLGNDLLFERFLHEHRLDAPDVDLDFCSRRRDEVRDELMRRYKHVGTAVVATASKMSLRGAVRVVARALGHTPREIDDLARHVPSRVKDRDRELHPVAAWDQALSEPAMRGHPLQDRRRYHLLLDLSWKLKGRLHEAGTHSAGVVFGTVERHLSEHIPLEPSGTPGLPRCQYDKDDLEFIGIPKLDMLGLRMHTALHEAGELVSKRLCKKVDVLSLPPDDKDTYALVRTGHNIGMFQLESPGQQVLSRRLKPRRFADIVASISLFRPGPVRGDLVTPYVLRRNAREEYSVPLPELEDVLRETYGVMVYQEQVLSAARAVAGFSLAEGDLLRRAMTKDRGPGAMDGIRQEFLQRARQRGVPSAGASQVFNWIEGFASYGFPKAHAASFAALAYSSAYMRTHYPAEFFCGILNAQPMGFFSPRVVLNEARRVGIRILLPDIHLSGNGFTVDDEGHALRVGLKYSKGLSQKALDSILEEREQRPFGSVADLYRRTAVSRDALENLVRAGFLDALHPDGVNGRTAMLFEATRLPKKPRRGQEELVHPATGWESREGRENISYLSASVSGESAEQEQRRILRLDVERHPLEPFRATLESLGVTPAVQMLDLPHGTRVRAAGIIEILQRPPTRSGRPVWFPLVEDESGLLQATMFEGVYGRYGHVLHHEPAYLLEGRVEQDPRRGFSYLVERIMPLRTALARATSPAGRFSRVGEAARTAG
ncbi:MAG: DNA polymerase III subunit alpha [Rubrobacteraceae bacterium]